MFYNIESNFNKVIEDIKNRDCISLKDDIEYNSEKIYLQLNFNKIIRNPALCKEIVNLITDKIQNIDFDAILSYNMISAPFVTMLSSHLNKSILIMDSNSIIGDIENDDKILVIKDINYSKIDLINTVNNLTDTINKLPKNNISLVHCISIIDYDINESNNIITLNNKSFIIESDYESIFSVSNFISFINTPILNKIDKLTSKSNTLQNIKNIIENKKTILVYKSNEFTKSNIMSEMQRFGHYILAFYFQAEGIRNFDEQFLRKIKNLSEKMSFILICDKRFDNSYSSVTRQYMNSLYRYSEWADIISCIYNKNSIKAIHECSGNILLLNNKAKENNIEHLKEYMENILISFIPNEKTLNIKLFDFIEERFIEKTILEEIRNDTNLILVDPSKFHNLSSESIQAFIIQLKDLSWKCQMEIGLEKKKSI